MKAGILIVGSLYWDSHPERQAWRSHCLMMDGAVRVHVPIRYGRVAKSRNETYTMTIGAKGALGTAVVVPCKPIATFYDLLTEACALWKAEQPNCADAKKIGSKVGSAEAWGCVGVLFRDAVRTLPEVTALSSEWKRHWAAHGGDRVLPLNEHGQLAIDLPKTVLGQEIDFDIILATATRDRRAEDISAEDVADRWVDRAHEYYFLNNVEQGIRTAEDVKIWEQIKRRSPPWLSYPKYARAIEVLEALARVADGHGS